MDSRQTIKSNLLLYMIWLAEGFVVGFGAILPGISGGTLCVAFGMYRPVIETISDIKTGLKKHGLMISIFLFGVAIGFIGLSGLASILMEKNTDIVTCAFIGFIIGTLPELWHDAGGEGRNKFSYISMIVAFIAMAVTLFLFKTNLHLDIQPDKYGFLICGILWGLSFIVPGLSSSSLLLFFGLYMPMLKGIAYLDFYVLIPMGIAAAICVLLLAKLVGRLYKKHFSVISHIVLGIVVATAIMIYPINSLTRTKLLIEIPVILLGAILSFIFGRICSNVKDKAEKKNSYEVTSLKTGNKQEF